MSLVVAAEYVKVSAKMELIEFEIIGTQEVNGETLYVVRKRKTSSIEDS